MAFSRRDGGRDFNRGGFRDRSSRGPVEMFQAVCDNCGNNCQVPFRPTSGKPVYCSDCFERMNRSSDNNRFEGRRDSRSRGSDERQLFDATCSNCGNKCKIPFQPTNDKPVYCSDCFGKMKNSANENRAKSVTTKDSYEIQNQLDILNSKLDLVLNLLQNNSNTAEIAITEAINPQIIQEDDTPKIDKPKRKTTKKQASK